MPPTLSDLQRQIDSLQAQIQVMQLSNGLPRALETALSERLPFLLAGTTGTASFNSFSSFNVSVPQVTGTLALTANGVTYKVLYE